jgi:HAD superfamily hydrolase (TIGR01509 family)
VIKVIMFDLGGTLVDDQRRPLPHAVQALAAIAKLKTAKSRPVASCLVSDFALAAPPVTPVKVKALFEEYLAILKSTGLAQYFMPAAKRVTLSTHANAMKPELIVFETALKRLGKKAMLNECLFITENAQHIAHARDHLGMRTLQFGGDFSDWADAPQLIAAILKPAE